MIAASPFSGERIHHSNHANNAHHPLNSSRRSNDAFLAGKIQSSRSFPERKMKISSDEAASTKLQGKTRIGLRNPPHLIYKALQEHKQKMSNALNDTNVNKLEHFNKLRQQLQSIEEEIKKLMLAQDEFPQQQAAAPTDTRQESPKRRNSIGRSTNIAREIETISSFEFIPNTQQRKRRHHRKVQAASFPVPLSIPEGEEEHCLWSSCPSLVYEAEPRDLPPKLPTRR